MPDNGEIEMIRATPADAERLTNIALSSKAHWGYPQKWLDSWRYSLTITPEYITQNDVCLARLDGQVVGFYALAQTATGLELDHLWLAPEVIGKGYGQALMEHALASARDRGAKEIEIQADPHAEGFYARMGAKRVGEFTYDLDGQQRVLPKMVISLF